MTKLLSRKLAITLTAVLTALTQTDLTMPQLIVVGAVTCAYVIAQAIADRGLVDKDTVEQVAQKVVGMLTAIENDNDSKR